MTDPNATSSEAERTQPRDYANLSDLTATEVLLRARSLGFSISDEDLPEVTYRFTALMSELQKLSKPSSVPDIPARER